MKRININRDYKKLLEYANTDYVNIEDDEVKNDFYWFDKKRYKFIHNKKFNNSNPDNKRYVRFIWFDGHYSMIDFYINLAKDKSVEEYLKSNDIESETINIRRFFDWNCIGVNKPYWEYNEYLEFTKRVTKWCENNGINYKFKLKAPNKKYLSAEFNSPDYEWIIPEYKD